MSEGPAARGLVLAHGTLAQGLVDATTKISGVDEGTLISISNEGKSPRTLQESIEAFLGSGPVVVFTDLPSGSCAMAARLCSRDDAQLVVVSGVNLPMLLDFVFNLQLPFEELVPRLLSKGTGSIVSFPDHS